MMTGNPALEPESMAGVGADAPPSFVKTWWVAMRPFALPASTMPVIFGTVLAVTLGGAEFSLPLFLGAFFGMALLHTGANLLNDVYDFKKGLDARVNPVSGAVVRGWVTPRQALVAGWLFLGLGSALGGFLVAMVGLPLLWIGIAGVAVGVFYTWGPFALKFHALGDLAVFVNFGVLGALGAWTVQTGSVSWVPAVWAIPIGLLVIGILHANNWRDIDSDKQGGIHTMASLFGPGGSVVYYSFLLFVPFLFVAGWVALSWTLELSPRMPLTSLMVLLALPLAIGLLKKGLRRKTAENPLDFLALDGATAQLNLVFGLLYTGSWGVDALITWLRV
jgi:1,4-dihydroxy-2-naphthoate octaprenyltransferase